GRRGSQAPENWCPQVMIDGAPHSESPVQVVAEGWQLPFLQVVPAPHTSPFVHGCPGPAGAWQVFLPPHARPILQSVSSSQAAPSAPRAWQTLLVLQKAPCSQASCAQG